jgi:hypothetical protein
MNPGEWKPCSNEEAPAETPMALHARQSISKSPVYNTSHGSFSPVRVAKIAIADPSANSMIGPATATNPAPIKALHAHTLSRL